MDIEGSVALVTGANRGLGKAFVEALLSAGAAKVYAGMRTPAPAPEGRIVPVKLDVTSAVDIAASVSACPDVSILINNAGILVRSTALDEGMGDILRRTMEVNVIGLANMARAFAPVLAQNGGGAIVNMLSVASWFTSPFSVPYSASKRAALGVSDAMRIQLAAQGTKVVGVYAGFIDTEMVADVTAPKVTARQVAERTMEGIRDEQSHVLADDRAEQVWRDMHANPGHMDAAMQRQWDEAHKN